MRPCCAPRNARRTLTPNGAADKPQRAENRRLSLPEVGLIRVVVRALRAAQQRPRSAAPDWPTRSGRQSGVGLERVVRPLLVPQGGKRVNSQWDAELSKCPHRGKADFQPVVTLIHEHPTEHVDANDMEGAANGSSGGCYTASRRSMTWRSSARSSSALMATSGGMQRKRRSRARLKAT